VLSDFLDKESRSGWLNDDFSSSVLALELDHDSDTFPFASFLDNIFSYLLRVLKKKIKDYFFTRPRGPNLGAKVEAGPPSPPKTLMLTKIDDQSHEKYY
jgi:hypothetical protein